jgi:diaminohydroxyphosphoribosylaminopyrimidine deaminase/5-amino-6-(5-phosphoribosylamino)uracil reductase
MPTPSVADNFDVQMMQRCLELARQAVGRTSPNPLVGCVIVQEGQIIGEGFHPAAGQPHAEVFALRAAGDWLCQHSPGDRPENATLYVNLEPCNHYGRTPPCTEAILQAGIRRVVVGMVDPDPRVSGSGIERLRQAGLEVIVGVEAAACQALNEAFAWRVTQQRPFGILKYAMTLDGRIATDRGHSQWITSPPARAWVHQLRASLDVVIVGGNTVRRDNPLLTSHGVGDHNPLRVVLSRTLDLPATAQLWQTDLAPTLILTEQGAESHNAEWLIQQGVEIQILPHLTPNAAFELLYQRGLSAVLWECGGTLAAEALREGCVQKIHAFIAPKLIGGSQFGPVADLGFAHMDAALTLQDLDVTTVGPDLLISGYVAGYPYCQSSV